MTYSVSGFQLLLPAPPQLAHQQRGHVSRNRCYAWAQQHGSITQPDPAAIAECPACQHVNGRDQSWDPNMATFPRRTSQPPGGKLITLDSFHHWGGSIFFLPGIVANYGDGSAFPVRVLLPAPPSVDLLNALFTVLVSHKIFLFWPKNFIL